MDTSIPFSSSSSFLDLLHSQQEISFSETLTQPTPTNPIPQTATKNRWTVLQETVLVSAWLNTSKDVIVGNQQRSGTFWTRVAEYYASTPSVAKLSIRESNTCKQKWSKMNEQVQKFAGCYECATRQKSSGQNEDDVLELAHKLYLQDQGKKAVKFGLEHVWRVLRKEEKWCKTPSKTKPIPKKSKLNESSAFSSNSTANTICLEEEETMQRPMGVKAAKGKGKKKVKPTAEESVEGSLKELQEMWIIKEKDFAMKEKEFAMKAKLSDKKMLESLLAKTEPLTEIEVTLKNKLINEIFLI